VIDTGLDPDNYTAAIAAELKAERAATGIQNDVLAKAANVSSRQIIRIFNGERSVSLQDTLLLCSALGLDIHEFLHRVQARVEKQRRA